MNDNDATTPASSRRPPGTSENSSAPSPRSARACLVDTEGLQLERRTRDHALFNLAIDSKLRGCDVVAVRVDDVAPNSYTLDRATVRQKKTGRPVRFELT